MTAEEALCGWDLLWRELRSAAAVRGAAQRRGARAIGVAVRERDEILAAMVVHAERAYALYRHTDAYRAAMWCRRAYLCRNGATDRIYDGTDAVDWQRLHDAGRRVPA